MPGFLLLRQLLPKLLPFALLLFVQPCAGQPLLFAMPLKGEQGRDFFIDNYVDHDSTQGIRDAMCGTKTYDGHKGTDMALRSFKTMDSGVYAYAAADGVVFVVHDGEYDRNKRWIKGRPANRVGILHKGKFCTYYLHLMKGSLMVKPGDSVKTGQPIGKVGSSGYSSTAHLHFEVRDSNDHVIDPFSGPCQQNNASMWRSQPEYDTAIYVIDAGFVPYVPGTDTLKERYLVRDTFYVGEDTTVVFWVMMHGRMKGKTAHAEWYTPMGVPYSDHRFLLQDEQWHGFVWPYIRMPTIKGTWTVRLLIDGKFVAGRNFHVLKRRKRNS